MRNTRAVLVACADDVRVGWASGDETLQTTLTGTSMPAFRDRLRSASGELAVAALVMAVSGVRMFWLYRLPAERLVQYVPDDAFYYIRLAANFAQHGRWTFDGVAPATGFHLLWAYLLAALFKLHPNSDWRTTFLLSGVVGCISLSMTAFFISIIVRRIFGIWSLLGIGSLFLSEGMLWQTTFVMESPLVLFCGALSLFLIHGSRGNRQVHWMPQALFIVGAVGTLSRSDFGLLPFWFVLVYSLSAWKARIWTPELKAALTVFVGTCCGVVVVLAHCHIVSGHWTQASAKEKLLWASLAGRSIAPPIIEIFTPLQPFGWIAHHVHARWPAVPLALTFSICVGIVSLLALLQARRRSPQPLSAGLLLTLGLVATIVSYMLVYRLDSQAVQPWYLASVATPIACLFGGASAWLVERSRKLVLPAFFVIALVGIKASVQSVWPGQEAFFEAALRLKDSHVEGPVGAWNAGILGYFSDAKVVNLDGLVNDDIYAYSVRVKLLDYMDRRSVVAVADSDRQFRFDAARLGISGRELSSCFLPPQLIGQVERQEARASDTSAGMDVRLRLRVPCR